MCITAEQVFDLIERGMEKYGDLAKLHRAAQKNLPSLSYDDVRDIKRQKTKIPKADIYEALRIAVDGAGVRKVKPLSPLSNSTLSPLRWQGLFFIVLPRAFPCVNGKLGIIPFLLLTLGIVPSNILP